MIAISVFFSHPASIRTGQTGIWLKGRFCASENAHHSAWITRRPPAMKKLRHGSSDLRSEEMMSVKCSCPNEGKQLPLFSRSWPPADSVKLSITRCKVGWALGCSRGLNLYQVVATSLARVLFFLFVTLTQQKPLIYFISMKCFNTPVHSYSPGLFTLSIPLA